MGTRAKAVLMSTHNLCCVQIFGKNTENKSAENFHLKAENATYCIGLFS